MTRVTANSLTLAELAALLDGKFSGPPSMAIHSVASLSEAGSTDLSFYHSTRYKKEFEESQAGVILVPLGTQEESGRPFIWVNDPYWAFAVAAEALLPKNALVPHIDPKAHIDPLACIDPSAHIEAFAWIGKRTKIGPRTHIEAHVRIGKDVTIGSDCHLMAGVVVRDDCHLGDGVVLHPNSVIGSDGFGYAASAMGHKKLPQLGGVRVASNVELGAASCVDRGALSDTHIGEGVKTDNFVQIAHGAHVGAHSLMVAYSGIAGSSKIGDHTKMGARSTVLGHITLGQDVSLAAGAMVNHNLPAHSKVAGVPAISLEKWRQAAAVFKRLPQLRHQVRRLASAYEVNSDPREILPHREPFILIDRLVELIPGQSGTAIKCLSLNEVWASGHYPEEPIYPGVLMLESMAQLAAAVALGRPIKDDETLLLRSIQKATFRNKAIPGDKLSIHATLLRSKMNLAYYSCSTQIDGRVIAEAQIGIMIKSD